MKKWLFIAMFGLAQQIAGQDGSPEFTVIKQTVEYNTTLQLSVLMKAYASENDGVAPGNWDDMVKFESRSIEMLDRRLPAPINKLYAFVENSPAIKELDAEQLILFRTEAVSDGENSSDKRYAIWLTNEGTIRNGGITEDQAQQLIKKYDLRFTESTINIGDRKSTNLDGGAVQIVENNALPSTQSEIQNKPTTVQEPTTNSVTKPASFPWLWIGVIVVIAGVVTFLVLQRQRT